MDLPETVCMSNKDRFCAECEVVKDLHWEPDEPTPEDCESAALKADLLALVCFQ